MAFKKGHPYGKRFKKGDIPWNKNLTKETDERVREYGKKGSITIKRLLKEGKLIPSRLGTHSSKETKEKSRDSHLGNKLFKESIIKREETRRKNGWFKNLEETREKMRIKRSKQITPTKDTSIEIKIQNFLKALGIEFFTHQHIKISHRYQCDIFIPSTKTIIECDGDFIHCNPKKYSPDFIRYPRYETKTAKDIWGVDNARTKELLEKGYNVIRIWGSKIRRMSINDFKKILNTKST